MKIKNMLKVYDGRMTVIKQQTTWHYRVTKHIENSLLEPSAQVKQLYINQTYLGYSMVVSEIIDSSLSI